MRKISLLLMMGLASNAYSQISSAIIDFNNVSAHVSDGGVLFNNLVNDPGYEIPKGSNNHAIYAASFWFASLDQGGAIRMSASRYNGGLDIFPGPIATVSGAYVSSDYTNQYSPSIWSVSKADIDTHILDYNLGGYITPASILDWPGNGDVSLGVAPQLAPFVDLNLNGIYEPILGDYPEIRGDFATYIIMNDVAQNHIETFTEPLGIEVHLMLYQYETNDYLNDVTFINTKVINRGAHNYSDFRSSFYTDADIGSFQDDYYGSDSSLNMVYTYNGNFVDIEYGAMPPAIGVMSLNTTMSGACYYTSTSPYPYNDPSTAPEYWNYMNNTWANGAPWVFGGLGYAGSVGSTNTPTNYLFSGNPLAPSSWAETNNSFPSGDRRMVMNMPSQSLPVNEYICYDYAVVFGQDTTSLLSVQKLKDNALALQNYYNSQLFNCFQLGVGLSELALPAYSIYPNPSNGTFNIVFEDEITDFTIRVMDLSGRLLLTEKHGLKSELSIKLEESSGVYLVTVETSKGTTSQRIIIE